MKIRIMAGMDDEEYRIIYKVQTTYNYRRKQIAMSYMSIYKINYKIYAYMKDIF